MTATNHFVTGALIASVEPNHALGLVLALLSHVLLDAIPHFGVAVENNLKIFVPVLVVDSALAAALILVIFFRQPHEYLWVISGGIAAASADLLSIPYFISSIKKRPHKFGKVQTFLGSVQWSESVPGIGVEVVWLGVIGAILFQKLFR